MTKTEKKVKHLQYVEQIEFSYIVGGNKQCIKLYKLCIKFRKFGNISETEHLHTL